jgi:ABC-type transport system involved in cytochrome c biogenesis permease subunit
MALVAASLLAAITILLRFVGQAPPLAAVMESATGAVALLWGLSSAFERLLSGSFLFSFLLSAFVVFFLLLPDPSD